MGVGLIGGVGITTNLLALTGLSALTMGAAKAVTTTKVDNAKQEAPAKNAAAEAAAANASVAAIAAQSAPDSISKDAHTAVATAAKQVAEAIAADAKLQRQRSRQVRRISRSICSRTTKSRWTSVTSR